MGTRIHQITARRVAGNLYQCTSSTVPSLCEELTWGRLCELTKSAKTREIKVVNNYRGENELPEITYTLSPTQRLEDMAHPSMATTAIVDYEVIG